MIAARLSGSRAWQDTTAAGYQYSQPMILTASTKNRLGLFRTMSFECIPCAKLFRSMQALEGHRRDAPAHHRQHRCSHCKRSFGSSCAHAQHVRDTGHTTYEPERSTHAESSGDMPGQLSDTTKLLARVSLDHTLGGTTTTLCDRATIKTGKKQIAAALEAFKLRFAESDNKIEQWQSLCVYVGIQTIPGSIT